MTSLVQRAVQALKAKLGVAMCDLNMIEDMGEAARHLEWTCVSFKIRGLQPSKKRELRSATSQLVNQAPKLGMHAEARPQAEIFDAFCDEMWEEIGSVCGCKAADDSKTDVRCYDLCVAKWLAVEGGVQTPKKLAKQEGGNHLRNCDDPRLKAIANKYLKLLRWSLRTTSHKFVSDLVWMALAVLVDRGRVTIDKPSELRRPVNGTGEYTERFWLEALVSQYKLSGWLLDMRKEFSFLSSCHHFATGAIDRLLWVCGWAPGSKLELTKSSIAWVVGMFTSGKDVAKGKEICSWKDVVWSSVLYLLNEQLVWSKRLRDQSTPWWETRAVILAHFFELYDVMVILGPGNTEKMSMQLVFFLIENPLNSEIWKRPELKRLLRRYAKDTSW